MDVAVPSSVGTAIPARARSGPVPPLELAGPSGTVWRIRPASWADTAGDLARALGVDPSELTIDGCPVEARRRLVDFPGLVRGSVVGNVTSAHPTSDPQGAVVEIAVTRGPAVSSWVAVRPGRHLVGRSQHTALRVDDPAVEPFHGLVDVSEDGEVRFTQLTGPHPARIDGRPCPPGRCVEPGAVLVLGSSGVEVRPVVVPMPSSVTTDPARPWHRVLHRSHVRVAADDVAVDLSTPTAPAVERPPLPTGIIGAVVAMVGGLAMALITGQPWFALFATIGAAASFATWACGWIGVVRRRRRAARVHSLALDDHVATVERARQRARQRHLERDPSATAALHIVRHGGEERWCRRLADGPLRATVGWGDHPWADGPLVEIATEVSAAAGVDARRTLERAVSLDAVTAPVVVLPGEVLGVRGPERMASAVIRSVVIQLATWYGPADWSLVVAVAEPPAWSWVGWLPHTSRRGDDPAILPSVDAAGLAEVLTDAGATASFGPTVVVTDDIEALGDCTGTLRRATARGRAAVLALLDEDAPVPAWCQRVLRVGATGRAHWCGPLTGTTHAASTSDVVVAGLSRSAAAEAARRLAPLVDPEASDRGAGELPTSVGLIELLETGLDAPLDPLSIASRWGGRRAVRSPITPIGRSRYGTITVDLVRDGPHALVAGTTGSGKSELLRSLVAGLAVASGPHELTFVLVDYKGGAAFDACTDLPHVVGVVTDLDEGMAARALTGLEAELRRRERILRAAGVADLTDLGASGDGGAGPRDVPPRLVVVVDEFAALARELPEFLHSLVDVAQRGRSLGIHLVLATQRPAGVVSSDIRANTSLRIALRLEDRSDADDVVGDPAPAAIPRAAPGRAVLRAGPDEPVLAQSAWSGRAHRRGARLLAARATWGSPSTVQTSERSNDPTVATASVPTELRAIVDAVRAAARRADLPAPVGPWVPAPSHPLPIGEMTERVPDAPIDSIGLVDDPGAQAVHPLRWDPTGGSLGVVGAVGSGVTSTLISLATAWCRRWAPDDLHLYVIDAQGDDRLDGLAAVAHCGGVIRPHDGERLHRLMSRLGSIIADRRRPASGRIGESSVPAPPTVVLAIDGLGPLRTALDAPGRVSTGLLLDRILREGPGVGVSAVAADHGMAVVGASCPVSERWVLRVDDAAALGALGVSAAVAAVRSQGRLVVVSSGLTAQVAVGAHGLAALPGRAESGGPPPLRLLPDVVSPDRLPVTTAPQRSDRCTPLVLGLEAEDLAPAVLMLRPGDHLLVVGTRRAGISTTLARMAAAWRQVHGDGSVTHWSPAIDLAGADLAEAGADRLVVIDDAHRVEDPDGRLTAWASGERSGPTLAAGGRLDGLRAAYGHWTRDVARSGCGAIMASGSAPDGDLLGVELPSHSTITARPGLAWLVDGDGPRLAQIARET